jgi:hypothetical protein
MNETSETDNLIEKKEEEDDFKVINDRRPFFYQKSVNFVLLIFLFSVCIVTFICDLIILIYYQKSIYACNNIFIFIFICKFF